MCEIQARKGQKTNGLSRIIKGRRIRRIRAILTQYIPSKTLNLHQYKETTDPSPPKS